jgi:hypothetical protein
VFVYPSTNQSPEELKSDIYRSIYINNTQIVAAILTVVLLKFDILIGITNNADKPKYFPSRTNVELKPIETNDMATYKHIITKKSLSTLVRLSILQFLDNKNSIIEHRLIKNGT